MLLIRSATLEKKTKVLLFNLFSNKESSHFITLAPNHSMLTLLSCKFRHVPPRRLMALCACSPVDNWRTNHPNHFRYTYKTWGLLVHILVHMKYTNANNLWLMESNVWKREDNKQRSISLLQVLSATLAFSSLRASSLNPVIFLEELV